jgi:hypothetical protein
LLAVYAGNFACSKILGAAVQIDRPLMLDIDPEPDRIAVCFEPEPSLDRPWSDRIH